MEFLLAHNVNKASWSFARRPPDWPPPQTRPGVSGAGGGGGGGCGGGCDHDDQIRGPQMFFIRSLTLENSNLAAAARIDRSIDFTGALASAFDFFPIGRKRAIRLELGRRSGEPDEGDQN